MRTLKQTPQLRRDLLQNYVNNFTTSACTLYVEHNGFAGKTNCNNPDILGERLYNSAFNSKHRLDSRLQLADYSSSNSMVSPAQVERMKTYMGRDHIQNRMQGSLFKQLDKIKEV